MKVNYYQVPNCSGFSNGKFYVHEALKFYERFNEDELRTVTLLKRTPKRVEIFIKKITHHER